MRKSFFITTVLAAVLAVTLGILRSEARYFTRLSLSDLAKVQPPAEYLSSSIADLNIRPAVDAYFKSGAAQDDPAQAIALVEMHAAGLFEQNPSREAVSVLFQELLKEYPDSPLIHCRYGSYLVMRLQMLAQKAPGHKFSALDSAEPDFIAAEEIARDARRELTLVRSLDPANSLACYEIAYSYFVFGRTDEAVTWMQRGFEAPEFDPGDDRVLSGCARVATGARLPEAEGLMAVYHVSRVAPSYRAGRIETLTSDLLSDRVMRRREYTSSSYAEYLAVFEDLTEKLFQTAAVSRQTQSSFVTAGILWRKMLSEAAVMKDDRLREAALSQLALASYRYLLLGEFRGALGLPTQQAIVELGIPFDLRLPFSHTAQVFARTFLLASIATVIPALLIGLVAIKVRRARQLALALFVLFIFASLGYSASFYSTIQERSSTTGALERRLEVVLKGPEYVRCEGQPAGRAEFRTDVAKDIFFDLDYTLQAARVLAYVGTRDTYEFLMDSLRDPALIRPSEVILALREATGLSFGYDPQGSKADNFDAITAWRDWWRENRDSFPETPAES